MAASPVLTIGTAFKAAGDQNVRMPLDLGDEPLVIELLTDPTTGEYDPNAAAIQTASVSVSPSGPTLSRTQLDYPYQISCLVSGGTAGTAYNLTYSITLMDADATILTRVGALVVK